jgi:aconitate hydratase
VASPEIVTALALAGTLKFNPMKDSLRNDDGEEIRLTPPTGDELPSRGFVSRDSGFVKPAKDGSKVQVAIDPSSKRLEALKPFHRWDGKDITDIPLLLKAKGKCTTDHISPAGPWLKFRGHLNNISDNLFIGAVNAFGYEPGKGKNVIKGDVSSFSDNARYYKSQDLGWITIGDENYGEGSSREHAAMEPRYLGGKAIIVKSFARIHETNLKKQGMLALTFKNPADYDVIQEDDRLSIMGLKKFESGKPLKLIIKHKDGSQNECGLNHSYNASQIKWFKAGSALNLIGGSKTTSKAKPQGSRTSAKKTVKKIKSKLKIKIKNQKSTIRKKAIKTRKR